MAVSRRHDVIGRFAAILFLGAFLANAQTTPQIDEWLPDGAVYVLHVDQPGQLLDLAADLKLNDVPGVGSDKGLQMIAGAVAKSAGTDIKGLVRNLTARGVTYAMYPGENSVWVFDAQDSTVVDPLQQFVKMAAGMATAQTKAFYQEYPGGVAAWSFDGKMFFARQGNRLLLASRSDMLKTLFTPHLQSSLAVSSLYLEAKRAANVGDRSTAAWAFVNMAMLNQYAPIQKSLASGKEPIDVILTGAVKQSLRGSKWLALSLCVDGGAIHLHATTDGKLDATAAGAFSNPGTIPGTGGVLPNLTVPHELAAATLWRDLGKFYAEKDVLFPLKTSGGILAENFLEIFFTGRELADEIFGRFQPQVRLVVARQQYDAAVGTPQEQYPAAALVFRVDPSKSAEFGEVFEEAWQKAVGLTNFTRGQQALPGLILDRQTHGGVTFTYGFFSARTEKDRAQLPVRFNMRPAIVRDGPYIILSTTDGLARDLIDAVNQEDGRVPTQTSIAHTVVEVTGPAEIASLLNINKASFVRQSVLTAGKKPAEASREFDSNVAWLNRLRRARLSIGANQADLDVELGK